MTLSRGGFRVLVRGVRGGERSLVKIFGGCQPLIHKHINRGLTYDMTPFEPQ